MGRPEKAAHNSEKDYSDLEAKRKACLEASQNSGETSAEFTLVCKCCYLEISPDPDMVSTWHGKLKANFEKAEQAKTKQQTTFDITIRQWSKEKESEGVIHDFVHAVCFAGINLECADGGIGCLFKRYCSAIKTMLCAKQLREKHL